MNAIEVNQISKSYTVKKQKVQALDQIELHVNSGELFGLIGPDGSGKTSLIRILSTLILADSGNATVTGFDVVHDFEKIRKSVGYMPGCFSLYQDLSVEENLEFFASVFNTSIRENYELIKDIYVQIEAFKDRRAGKLSGGMKQKLALCCALIHRPQVLFLDEPTTGVDAVSRREFWEMLKKLQSQGISIFVSTPYMDEAALCDRVALIQEGKILKIDTPLHIVQNFEGKLFSVRTADMYLMMQDLKKWDAVNSCFAFGDHCHLTVNNPHKNEQDIYNYLHEKKHEEIMVKLIQAHIEDCFMQLMPKA